MKINQWLVSGAILALPGWVLAADPPARAEIEAERAALVAQADADTSGTLSLAEFKVFEALVRDKMAEHHFNHVDTDGDGALSLDELQTDHPRRGPGRRGGPW
ncbi:MAG: EF-hand domain-containing protein [Deltaproteobacteria bacterium]|nr:EF-hand domain-containing protein [Deltaproteobacteria bacterium]